jgi:predicted O-methyltransferase YrrM
VNNIHDDLIPKFNKIIESGDAKHIFDFSNHYLFLLALANVTQAKQIVEVGTASGSSLWAWLNAKCVEHVYTFDIVPIEDSQHWFTSSTHSSTVNEVLASERRRFTQYIEDLSVDANFDNRRSFIEHADIIFIDGPHDGNFERKIFSRITKLKFRRNVYVLDSTFTYRQ